MAIQKTQSGSGERELIARAQGGDRAAFKALYDRYRDRVYNLIFYSIGEELSSEDILQIVFIKIYKGLPGFRFESNDLDLSNHPERVLESAAAARRAIRPV
jgi:hypothetical protein